MINPTTQIKYHNIVTDKDEHYNVIELEEKAQVAEETVMNTHRYWVPINADISNRDNYLEPKTDPDFNIHADFAEYRKQFNFLTPAEIKATRERIGLSLRETATLLGMGFSTLSNIERDLVLQSYTQQLKLDYLTEPTQLKKLVSMHHSLIESRFEGRGLNAKKMFQTINTYLKTQNL
ncbi:hypothetical protein AYR62_01010 [Secundilactobacillus paracollinoides]|uniref:HTH cro/C1-type domain-containing protein n=1 Tax=Secundilactobacillus paracollinoides TaxID=240427 RepID=A0A1B2IVF1_9LACO|nr:helix-turn-helix domain-containing protein [Secundilactobacillus paracollinoides]ANZ60227.1 hypothetical protein AYR61_01910 [Secundilactobacillus paracollinoides]ANZ62818.1 hypothetical protein AYR62_01010 [Secundilactobacillus paracollinoides]ANZ66022.1 hypothetical protein AYR63_01930 [Secundilactobacillus paracollinoides]KRL76753.1 hypothetical protein FC17_GL001648 [Secundilactobacillus paracollinoides DSM 15502 = JCM 11969]